MLPNTSIINSKCPVPPLKPTSLPHGTPRVSHPRADSPPGALSLCLQLSKLPCAASLANTHQQNETQRSLPLHVCIPSTVCLKHEGSCLWADCGKCVMLSNSTIINCSNGKGSYSESTIVLYQTMEKLRSQNTGSQPNTLTSLVCWDPSCCGLSLWMVARRS